jgi:hypothetical protein
VNYNGRRGESPFDQFSTVPTLLERQGNFSKTIYPSDLNAGQPVQIFNPATNTPFANNTIPSINPVAQGLLQYIPQPNLPGTFQNFHYVTASTNNSDDLNIRVNRNFGAAPQRGRGRFGQRNTLAFGLHFHNADANLTNPFPSLGGATGARSFDVPISYARSFGRVTNIVRFDFNRSRTRTQNLYAFRYRRITVRLKRGDLKIQYRRGYYAPADYRHANGDDRERRLEGELASELPATDLPLYMGLAYFRWQGNRFAIPVSLVVPGSEIPFTRSSDRDKAALDVIGIALDARQTAVSNIRDTVKLAVNASAEVRRKNVQYNTVLLLPAGKYHLKFVVRENQTGRMGSFETISTCPI